MHSKLVLVTGSTGYIGGRLVPLLLQRGHSVRCMARSLSKLACRPWATDPKAELVRGDVLDLESLKEAARGCSTAYYLVHSMNPGSSDFAQTDRTAASNMVEAAARGNLSRLVYLGGLGDERSALSPHLRSRHEVARILKSGPVPVTFLRAAVILGSGSASFEIMRYLVDRLPVMITPRWVHTPCQPVAVRNVLEILAGCLEHEETTGQTYDIGGPEILSYRRLMEIYAEEAGLRRRIIIPVPVFSTQLSSYWIHLITPLPSALARPLAESLRNPMICRDTRIRSIIPQEWVSPRQAIRLALEHTRRNRIETCWMDAGPVSTPEWVDCGDAPYAGGTVLTCAWRIRIQAGPEEVWAPIQRLGGRSGWHFANALWTMRGWMDLVLGGVNRRRGRRHPQELFVGDALDLWRVLEIRPPERLLLWGEMKAPGEATLEFNALPVGDGVIELRQIGRFLPRGLAGLAYWYGLYPIHQRMFRGTLLNLARSTGKPITSPPEPFDPSETSDCRTSPSASGSTIPPAEAR